MDLLLDEATGDLDITKGVQVVIGNDELRQRIEIALTLNLGEFFTHINHGLPWLRNETADNGNRDTVYFLGEDTTVQFIVNEIDKYLLTIDQVVKVTSTYEMDKVSRTLLYSPSITGLGGNVIDFPPYQLNI